MPLSQLAATEPRLLLDLIALQSEVAAAADDLDAVLTLAAEHAARLTGADAGAVALLDGDDLVVRGVSGSARGLGGARLSVATSLAGHAVREEAVRRCDDVEEDPRVDLRSARLAGARSVVCAPLRHGGEPLGILEVFAGRPAAFDDDATVLVDALSRSIGAHVAHATELERRWIESRSDALTDLGNRRAYDERLVKEVARAARYEHPLSLVVVDLDRFKAVNDALGHAAGDAALQETAKVLRGLRTTDDCFRVGGDEFAVLLPDTPLEGAHVVADRVTAGIASGGRITASAGAACFAGEDAAALHAAADAALLAAKRARRP